MSEWREQPIETLELLRHAEPKPCFLCDGENRFDTQACRHCGAPLTLGFEADESPIRRHLVAVLGTPAAGKTVYLGMLTDILSRQQDALQVVARGAYSVSLQQQTMAALARRHFPPRTTTSPDGWNWVHFEVNGLQRKRRIGLILPDIAGGAFLANLKHGADVPAIRGFLTKCSAALLLVDTERIERGDREQDFAAMKMVNYLGELAADRKSGWPARPVAVVFAKTDHSPTCALDPSAYAQQCAPGLFRQCRERLKRHQFFATSVVGSSATTLCQGHRLSIPLRVEPHGIVEPFQWVVSQL
jgi:hypothetical protein